MENSYKKVWINKEYKSMVKNGLEKIGLALEMLEHEHRHCAERYINITSVPFRRKAAETAGKCTVSVFRIYCWLDELMRRKHNGVNSIPTLAEYLDRHFNVKASVKKEVIKDGKSSVHARKTPLRSKTGSVRYHIPAHEERTEDYVNGVKYRVIVYFGRNYR